jgi:hypothetical protein
MEDVLSNVYPCIEIPKYSTTNRMNIHLLKLMEIINDASTIQQFKLLYIISELYIIGFHLCNITKIIGNI